MTVKILLPLFALCALTIIVSSIYINANSPAKVEELVSNPNKFRFEHFHNYKSFNESLSVLLSEGMDKKTVDDIFVQNAGATVKTISEGEKDSFTYRKSTLSAYMFCGLTSKGKPEWRFQVNYDSESKLERFTDASTDNQLFKAVWPCF